ncbi:MAG: mycofactocin biosynthesis chaperone MftB [SAR324 cluster bacterium]|nr:mycofactocin biosynthesis chaperone MftB [SAR324 cluster bacterium]
MKTKYQLAEGTQVREEEFGLLFYTREGPRLFFVSSGDLLSEIFFQGLLSLEEGVTNSQIQSPEAEARLKELQVSLAKLSDKGVIHEC